MLLEVLTFAPGISERCLGSCGGTGKTRPSSLAASPPEQMFRSLRLLFQDSCLLLLLLFFKLIFVEVSTDYKYTSNEFCYSEAPVALPQPLRAHSRQSPALIWPLEHSV